MASKIASTGAPAAALGDAGDRVAEIEHHWSALVGRTRFDDAGRAVQDLLDQLEQEHPEDARP